MIIRSYEPQDEAGWLKCRVLAFLDCSYRNDIRTEKETYEKPSVCLVAEEDGEIIGLIDVELDSDQLSYPEKAPGAIVWNMAVLPQYRRQGVARKLWEAAKEQVLRSGITYCEIWTQEDEAANKLYSSFGLSLMKEKCWLRCRAEGERCESLLQKDVIGPMYGPEFLLFDVPLSQREKVEPFCSHIDEVRLYAGTL